MLSQSITKYVPKGNNLFIFSFLKISNSRLNTIKDNFMSVFLTFTVRQSGKSMENNIEEKIKMITNNSNIKKGG